jgi:hypothetical protein
MIFLRNNVRIMFKTKKSPNIECGFGDSFYVLLYANNTVVVNNKAEKLCYPVPVDYPSFLLTVFGKLSKNVDEMFTFKNNSERDEFYKYVQIVNMENARIIKEFKNIK